MKIIPKKRNGVQEEKKGKEICKNMFINLKRKLTLLNNSYFYVYKQSGTKLYDRNNIQNRKGKGEAFKDSCLIEEKKED